MKLYWRIKVDGKWTWIAATKHNTTSGYFVPFMKFVYKEDLE